MIHEHLKLKMKVLLKDGFNHFIYPKFSPKFAERIWINPNDVMGIIRLGKKYSAKVIDFNLKDFSDMIRELHDDERIKSCIDHWINAIPWEETTDYRKKVYELKNTGKTWDNDCFSVKDLDRKYQFLDQLFMELSQTRKMLTSEQIDQNHFRELNTFGIHIGSKGELYLDSGGYHRFAIAYILKLERVPARLGAIDKRQLSKLKELRRKAI